MHPVVAACATTARRSGGFEWRRNAGLAEAQYNLGIMYADGRGVERDMSQAARWYRQAAEQGIAEAQYNLGTLYGTGVGVPQDEERAAQWLHRAADLELPQAQYNLGVLYEHGRGVRLDGRAALVWYRRAADQGYAAAADRLGALREKLKVDEWPEPVVAPGTLSEVASLVPSDRVADSEEIAESEVRVAALIEPALTKVELAEPLELPPSATRVEAGDGWLETVDPTGYTLQVASDTDEASIQRLVRELITEPAGYFASTKQGTIWYSAVVGLYDSYESAKAAIGRAPAGATPSRAVGQKHRAHPGGDAQGCRGIAGRCYRPLVPLAEDRGADSHQGRSLGDSRLQVVGHADGQRVEIEPARVQLPHQLA